jgi:mono/diheme cytochrome c family protein
MRRSTRGGWLVAALIGTVLTGARAAEDTDIFAFIPDGGRTLLSQVLAGKPAPDAAQAILGGKHSRDEWLAELRSRATAMPAVGHFDDQQLNTLADYLAFNMPLPTDQVPRDLARADAPGVLPMDGRDMALKYCQSCHIITVVITQDRSREAWLGTMHKPSHIQIKLTEPQREALANYLVLNAGIPIDQVPEDLRAGGATY